MSCDNITRAGEKTVVLTGATGGIGRNLSKRVLSMGSRLIMLNRDPVKTEALIDDLKRQYPNADISFFLVDFSDIDSVVNVCEKLKDIPVDHLILNAGAYSVPRTICSSGYNNIFEINFVSPYYLTRELLPNLSKRHGKVTAVGSIAYKLSEADENDVDFSRKKAAIRIYGNSKKYLMFSLYDLADHFDDISVSIAHPGITYTGITRGYPKIVSLLIKYPMRLIFMSPKRSSRCIVEGMTHDFPPHSWVGPRILNIWGRPRVSTLKPLPKEENDFIVHTAENSYREIKEHSHKNCV